MSKNPVSKILRESADLFSSKNADYGDAYIRSSDIMSILVPDKSRLNTRLKQVVYHNMTTMVSKLLRISNIFLNCQKTMANHESVLDSWKDLAVFAAMMADLCQSGLEDK